MRSLLTFIVFATIGLSSDFVRAQDTKPAGEADPLGANAVDCGDERVLALLWQDKYQHFVTLPDPPTGLSNGYAQKVSAALCFLEHSGLPSSVDYYAYFRSSGVKIVVVPNGNHSAFAASDYGAKTIFLYPKYFDDDAIMFYKRVSVLVHEARHFEMNALNMPYNAHVICQNGGDKDGQRNCDEEFIANWDRAGPTSFEVMYLRKLYEQSSLPLRKADLRAWIIQMLDNSFNHVSPELRKRFVRL